MALFGNAGSTSAASKNLVEFKCGKMRIKGRTVTADKRKGMLYIHQSEDSLIHLCWKEREKGKIEDDLIIFPDDCEWKKVPQCTTGRVFVLKFNSSLRRIFFWMQEPKEDKDDDLCKKVNDAMNNPPKLGRGGGGAAGLSDLTDALGQGNLQDLFNNVDHQQLLQIMAAGGGLGNLLTPVRSNSRTQQQRSGSTTSTTAKPATTAAAETVTESEDTSTSSKGAATPAASTTATSGNAGQEPVKLSQLQDILSNIQKPATPIDLSEAITPEAMIPILSDPAVQERLRPHLPHGSEAFNADADELRATARSPHFRQAMASFSAALASGQLGPLLAQFGLPQAAQDAANKGDVEEFAKAMQESAKNAGEEEKMNVD